MKSTFPSQVLLAASTEGASWLQVIQVGAQNQNATGRPATDAPLNSPPPPTSGAVNCSTFATVAPSGDPFAELVSDGASEDPHATSETTVNAQITRSRSTEDHRDRRFVP